MAPMYEVDPTKSSRFPPEIENLIFVWSARSKPGFAPTLSAVCKRVQTWVEAVIYESLYIVHAGTIDDVPDAFEPEQARDSRIFPTLLSRPAEFFAANVYNLCILPDVSCTLREVALLKCTSIRHLALFEEGEGHHIIDESGVLVGISFTTVVSLNTTKNILEEMMDLKIELPNVAFLAIRCAAFDEQIVPSLDWLPAVKTVQLYLQKPYEARWEKDVAKVLATTPQLQELWLDLWTIYYEVETYVDRHGIPSGVTIYVRNVHAHYHYIWEWRARIAGYMTIPRESLDCDKGGTRRSKGIVDCECSCWDPDEYEEDGNPHDTSPSPESDSNPESESDTE
ncbi:hypothetical protein H0H92_005825 [Tricholoma furcatifolium]|nr:hypothetical protein H0H92_005825 [Tricholoma furcatifolium]